MALSDGGSIRVQLGGLNQILSPDWLQFCWACVLEDRKQFGECYWHRLHQLPGVKICPVHTLVLQQSHVSAKHHRPAYEFISAEQSLHQTELAQSVNLGSIHPTFLKIANDATWLLAQCRLVPGSQLLRRRYLKLLADAGLLRNGRTICVEQLLKVFQNSYPVDCLKLLQCEVDQHRRPVWILKVVENWQPYQHPLRHLLLINLLGYTAQQFFNVV